jgi:hypothetical protein
VNVVKTNKKKKKKKKNKKKKKKKKKKKCGLLNEEMELNYGMDHREDQQ